MPLFRFCSLDPTHATPEDLFLKPIWFVPFQDDPVPLVNREPDRLTTTPLSPAMLQVAGGFPSHYLSPEQMAQFLEATDS